MGGIFICSSQLMYGAGRYPATTLWQVPQLPDFQTSNMGQIRLGNRSHPFLDGKTRHWFESRDDSSYVLT